MAKRHAEVDWVLRAQSAVTTAPLGPRLVLAKPLTYMNRSGEAVDHLLDLLDIRPVQMLVIVDDIDLPLGSIRLRPLGGPGTHNGLRSICDRIGRSYPRLRIGVRGDDQIGDLADYVLSPFSEAELERLPEIVHQATDAVEVAVLEGCERAMSLFNRVSDHSTRGPAVVEPPNTGHDRS
jgi:PTH1 family peptidyl-tRNA hydrolase